MDVCNSRSFQSCCPSTIRLHSGHSFAHDGSKQRFTKSSVPSSMTCFAHTSSMMPKARKQIRQRVTQFADAKRGIPELQASTILQGFVLGLLRQI